MTQTVEPPSARSETGMPTRVKPSFLEAGLPCAALSAESQRDNNARQRPPQNRLHIWWARRSPTVSRAAVLAGLLPYDLSLDESVLAAEVPEPSAADADNLPAKLEEHRQFFEQLLTDIKPAPLTREHTMFLRALGVTGDPVAAEQRIMAANEYLVGGRPIQMPPVWGFRHSPAFTVSPSESLLRSLLAEAQRGAQLSTDEPVVLLDFMAGGGSIPLEGVRYGLKVHANDLNPVAALVLRATLQYTAQFGRQLSPALSSSTESIAERVGSRLSLYFHHQAGSEWWQEVSEAATAKFSSKNVVARGPGGSERIQATLWVRQVPCAGCGLQIPISTNFTIVSVKGKPDASIAAFPEVPTREQGNTCTFRIVSRAEWKDCTWPMPGFTEWSPSVTPTFKDGKAICPRCGRVADGDEVKAIAQSRPGGLPAQMYAVCSQVPVQLTYKNGAHKVRYLWRFRAPTTADLDAVRAAEEELARLLPRWEAQDQIPSEEIPEGEKTREPRNMGITRWRDLFLPRQLLTNGVVLEEIRAAQARARAQLSPEEAEAVNVYLAFIQSKVVNYNSVNTFWHSGRKTVTQTFSRHDFAFRPAFCEFEGARETVLWGAKQVISAYEQIAGLIHGEQVELSGDDEDGEDDVVSEAAESDRDEVSPDGGLVSAASPVEVHLRPEVIVPTITNDDAAALSVPPPGSVHLLCVDPPYYNNVQYSELSNFFYVWLKRALRDEPNLAPLFREPLAESNREAVANAARWQREAEREQSAWQVRYDTAFNSLRAQKVKAADAKERALAAAGPRPRTAKDRADDFYLDKMAQVFRRARQLLHPAGRMVVMFNHKQTWAWRSLGMALIRAGFEVRSSAPIHTEAESSLNIRGLDAARSTVLLLCQPRQDREQPVGNWGTVQSAVARTARGAANRFASQGLTGTDLYLSALGPAIGEVARNSPVTDLAGCEVDLGDALEAAYRSVGRWRLEQVLAELTEKGRFAEVGQDFSAETVDPDTQTLWLWLDTFQGATASSDDVRKLAKSLNVNPDEFRRMGLIAQDKDLFILQSPLAVDLRALSRRLQGVDARTGRAGRETDAWEQRVFPNFVGAAAWNATALMNGSGAGDELARGPEAVRRWLAESGYGAQREFRGAFAVTLYLLERVFGRRPEGDEWGDAARQARRVWDLVLDRWRA